MSKSCSSVLSLVIYVKLYRAIQLSCGCSHVFMHVAMAEASVQRGSLCTCANFYVALLLIDLQLSMNDQD